MADENNPEADPPKEQSRLALVVALLVMLLPAGIPIYFALGTEDADSALLLYMMALAVALFNVIIVFALWKWITSLRP